MSVLLTPRIYQVFSYTGYPALSLKQSEIVTKIYDKVYRTKNQISKTNSLVNNTKENLSKQKGVYLKNESKTVLPSLVNKNRCINEKPASLQKNSVSNKEKKKEDANSLSQVLVKSDGGNVYRDFAFSYNTIGFVENLAGEYSLYYLMMVVGFIIVLFRKLWSLEYTVIFSFFILNSLIFLFLNPLSKQYFVLNTALLLPFLIICYKEHLMLMKGNGIRTVFLIFIFVVVLFQIFFGFNSAADTGISNYTKRFGLWINENRKEFNKAEADSLSPLTVLTFYKPQIAYWADSDIIFPKDKSIANINNIIENGIKKEKIFYEIDSLNKNKIIKPDLIISYNRPGFSDINEYLIQNSRLKYVKNSVKGNILLFKRK